MSILSKKFSHIAHFLVHWSIWHHTNIIHTLSVIIILFISQVDPWNYCNNLRYLQNINLIRLVFNSQKYLFKVNLFLLRVTIAQRCSSRFTERWRFLEIHLSLLLLTQSVDKFSKTISVFRLFKNNKENKHTLSNIEDVVQSSQGIIARWGSWWSTVEIEQYLKYRLTDPEKGVSCHI